MEETVVVHHDESQSLFSNWKMMRVENLSPGIVVEVYGQRVEQNGAYSCELNKVGKCRI